jgi:thiol:disulfide interchange protein
MWQPFSDAKLEALKGQNVFVDMTADWCLTCKVNERLVFDDSEVQDRLRKKGIVMLKGDWTQQNEEITKFLNRYDRVGVPFYVLFSRRNPAGRALPEVLTKAEFLDFLDKEYP